MRFYSVVFVADRSRPSLKAQVIYNLFNDPTSSCLRAFAIFARYESSVRLDVQRTLWYCAKMAKNAKILKLFIGIVIGYGLSHLIQLNSATCKQNTAVHEEEHNTQNSSQNDGKLLFVGVMTAAKYLENRAQAIQDTWAKNVPGSLVFFSSEASYSKSLPLVSLVGIDDSYPPQKKSFAMLKYMHDHFIDQYEWFMRADDDVYVRMDRLESLLRSVDSRKPWFIGQTGKSIHYYLLKLQVINQIISILIYLYIYIYLSTYICMYI